MADLRVDGALELSLGEKVREAGQAAHTFFDLVLPAGAGLEGDVRVGHKPAGDLHHVGLAGGQDLLHELRFHQGAHGGDGGLDVLFDLGGVLHVAAVGEEHAGMGDGEDLLHLVAAGGDVDQVAVAVHGLGRGDAGLDAEAAVVALAAGDADLDGEAGAHRLAHGLQHLHQQAGAVLVGAAPAVGAGVDERERNWCSSQPWPA